MEIKDTKQFTVPQRFRKSEKEKIPEPQVGQDRVEIKKDDDDKALALYMRFAIDKNNNKKVDEGEVVRFYEDLSPKDTDDNKKIQEKELEGIFFEYSKDTWLEAGKTNYMPMEGDYHAKVELKEINLATGGLNLDISLELDE